MIMHDFTLERKGRGKNQMMLPFIQLDFPVTHFLGRIWVSDLHHHESSQATFLAALKMQPRVLSQSFYCEIEK